MTYKHISSGSKLLRENWEKIKSGEFVPIVECGIPCLKENKLFPRGKMTVLHGLSGSGKSTLAFQVALGTAIELYRTGSAGAVVINSLEMQEEALIERIAAILSGVDVSGWLNNTVSDTDYRRLLNWVEFADVLPIYIDDNSFIKTTTMCEEADKLHKSKLGPIVMLITDYGELFTDEDNSEEQRMNAIFRNQMRLAHTLNCAVIGISQSTNNKNETGRTYIAGADGTRYSRGILQSSDILVELWNPPQILASGRPIDQKKIEAKGLSLAHPYLMTQKERYGSISEEMIPLGWIPERTSFFDKTLSQSKGSETIFTHLKEARDKFDGKVARKATW